MADHEDHAVPEGGVTEVVSVPTGLRPGAVAGVPLSALVAQVDAALTDGTAVPDVTVTGVTLRAQDVMPGDCSPRWPVRPPTGPGTPRGRSSAARPPC